MTYMRRNLTAKKMDETPIVFYTGSISPFLIAKEFDGGWGSSVSFTPTPDTVITQGLFYSFMDSSNKHLCLSNVSQVVQGYGSYEYSNGNFINPRLDQLWTGTNDYRLNAFAFSESGQEYISSQYYAPPTLEGSYEREYSYNPSNGDIGTLLQSYRFTPAPAGFGIQWEHNGYTYYHEQQEATIGIRIRAENRTTNSNTDLIVDPAVDYYSVSYHPSILDDNDAGVMSCIGTNRDLKLYRIIDDTSFLFSTIAGQRYAGIGSNGLLFSVPNLTETLICKRINGNGTITDLNGIATSGRILSLEYIEEMNTLFTFERDNVTKESYVKAYSVDGDGIVSQYSGGIDIGVAATQWGSVSVRHPTWTNTRMTQYGSTIF